MGQVASPSNINRGRGCVILLAGLACDVSNQVIDLTLALALAQVSILNLAKPIEGCGKS